MDCAWGDCRWVCLAVLLTFNRRERGRNQKRLKYGITLTFFVVDQNKAGEIWAIALSADGNYLASSSINGKVNVWSLSEEGMPKIREYETKGSFGMCVDLVSTPPFFQSKSMLSAIPMLHLL
jgi:WD40 repeat protein